MLKSEYLSIWGIDGRTNNDREKDVVPDYSNTKINAENWFEIDSAKLNGPTFLFPLYIFYLKLKKMFEFLNSVTEKERNRLKLP